MKKMCRKIDYVTVKGSNVPISLYTFDITNCNKAVSLPKLEPVLFIYYRKKVMIEDLVYVKE